jgi:elongator complex protein 3
MMPNLYGSTPKNDLNDLKQLFDNQAYRPDWLKIYPCVVVPWSELADYLKKGIYCPYDDLKLINLLVKMNQIFPKYVRVTRLYRDIPANRILGGCKISNLRQIVDKEMLKKGIISNDIRAREIKDIEVDIADLKMNVMEYKSSEGQEFFISFDYPEKNKLCSLLRLRFSSYSLNGKQHFIKELDGCAIVREIHTYGEQIKISKSDHGASQHLGLGKQMLAKAELIAKKSGFKKIAVISGIGVREYYRKNGYQQIGTYMIKNI